MTIPFIDIHTHQPVIARDTIAVQNLFLDELDFDYIQDKPFSTGIHPWHADFFSVEKIGELLEKLVSQPQLAAIGETGLDKHCGANSTNQKRLFEQHIYFAERHHKPMIIHAVKSWNELTGYFRQLKVPIIIHGYMGKPQLTKQLINIGCSFSFGKAIERFTPLQLETVKLIPSNALFLETDNSNGKIGDIYFQTAKIKNQTLEELKLQIFTNYKNLI